MPLVRTEIERTLFEPHGGCIALENVAHALEGKFDRHDLVLPQESLQPFDLNRIAGDGREVFLFLDTVYHEAFSHWFFESLIFIEEALALKAKFPALKIYCLADKAYKREFFSYFGLECVSSLPVQNILLLLPRVTSLNLSDDLCNYQTRLRRFRSFLLNYARSATAPACEVVMIPRQKAGNFAGNDRAVDASDIEGKVAALPSATVLYTDRGLGLGHQLAAVGRCQTLIVPDGSAFLVNAFLARNALVLVLGAKLVPGQARKFDKMAAILEIIREDNDVLFVSKPADNFVWPDIEPFLSQRYRFPREVRRLREATLPASVLGSLS